MKFLFTPSFCVLLAGICSAQTSIAAKDAKAHIGETVTVSENSSNLLGHHLRTYCPMNN
jgi:hypothetical protein